MKTNAGWIVALALISAACLNGPLNSMAASSAQVEEATAMMDPQQRADAARREKDPSWKPSCDQVGLIQVGDSKKPGALKLLPQRRGQHLGELRAKGGFGEIYSHGRAGHPRLLTNG